MNVTYTPGPMKREDKITNDALVEIRAIIETALLEITNEGQIEVDRDAHHNMGWLDAILAIVDRGLTTIEETT